MLKVLFQGAGEIKLVSETREDREPETSTKYLPIPNLELTSIANKLPPNGAPKNAASAPAIPIKVCFRTKLRLVQPNTRLDTNPPKEAHIATNGASGPKDPPPTMENCDAQTYGS